MTDSFVPICLDGTAGRGTGSVPNDPTFGGPFPPVPLPVIATLASVADRSESGTASALVEAGLILTSELSLPAVLQKIIDLACKVADARYGALGVLDPEGTKLEDFVTHGVTEAERRAIGALPEGHGILGVLITEERPMRLKRITDDDRHVGFPPHHPPMRSFLGVPIKVGSRAFGNLYLTEKRGADDFSEDDERAVVTLAAQAAIAIDNARLYQQARSHQNRLAALNDVARAILEGTDEVAVLSLIAGQARRLVGASMAAVTVPAVDDSLTIAVVDGDRADELSGATFPRSATLWDHVMASGAPIVLGDPSEDPHLGLPTALADVAGPLMVVPLVDATSTYGSLAIAKPKGAKRFDENDLTIIGLFATQAAVTMGYARARRELERLAVLEDRERIARELHDGVVQSLFAVGMSLQVLASNAEGDTRTKLSSAVEGVDSAIRDLRNYIFALRPGDEADRQLMRGLTDLAAEFAAVTHATIEVQVDPAIAGALASRAPGLIQVAREALSNAIRHSGAAVIRLGLERSGDSAVLSVSDDGAGFDVEAAAGVGRGLGNLRARAGSLGAELSIGTSADGGTSVALSVPL